MEITLEKIDQIVERTGVSYEVAKEALTSTNGDVVDALIYLEKKNKNVFQGINEKSAEMMESLKEVLKKGNVTRVIVEKDGDVLLNLPVTVGAIGLVLGPVATIIGVSAAVVSKYKIKIVKDDGETLDLNEMTEGTFNEIKEKMPFMKNKENKDITDEVIQETKGDNPQDLDK